MAQVVYDFKPNPLAGVGDALGILGKALDKRWTDDAKKADQSVLAEILAAQASGQAPLTKDTLQEYLGKLKTAEGGQILNALLSRQAADAQKSTVLNEGDILTRGGQTVASNPKTEKDFVPDPTGRGFYQKNADGSWGYQERQQTQGELADRNLKERLTTAQISGIEAGAEKDRRDASGVAGPPKNEAQVMFHMAQQMPGGATPENLNKAANLYKSQTTNDPMSAIKMQTKMVNDHLETLLKNIVDPTPAQMKEAHSMAQSMAEDDISKALGVYQQNAQNLGKGKNIGGQQQPPGGGQAPPGAPAMPKVAPKGYTATHPKTGQRFVSDGKQWVPMGGR